MCEKCEPNLQYLLEQLCLIANATYHYTNDYNSKIQIKYTENELNAIIEGRGKKVIIILDDDE